MPLGFKEQATEDAIGAAEKQQEKLLQVTSPETGLVTQLSPNDFRVDYDAMRRVRLQEDVREQELEQQTLLAEKEQVKRSAAEAEALRRNAPGVLSQMNDTIKENALFKSTSAGMTNAINNTSEALNEIFGVKDFVKTHFGVELEGLGSDGDLLFTPEETGMSPETTFERVATGIIEFVGPFTPAVGVASKVTTTALKVAAKSRRAVKPSLRTKSPLTKFGKLMRTNKVLAGSVNGVLAGIPVDALAIKPEDGNLADILIQTHLISEDSTLGQMLKEFVGFNSEDSRAMQGAKSAFTNAVGGILVEKVIRLIGRGIAKARKPKELEAEVREAIAEDTETIADAVQNLSPEAKKDLFEGLPGGEETLRREQLEFDFNPDGTKSNSQVTSEIHAASKLRGAKNEYNSSASPERNLESLDPEKSFSPDELDDLVDVFMRAGKGEMRAIDDLSIPFNLDKVIGPESMKRLLFNVAEAMSDRLPKNLDEKELVADFADFAGVSADEMQKSLEKTVGNVKNAKAYVVAAKAFAMLRTKKAMQAVEKYNIDPTGNNEFLMRRAVVESASTVEAASGLSYEASDLLRTFKKTSRGDDLEDVNSLRTQIAMRILYPDVKTSEALASQASNIQRITKSLDDQATNFEKEGSQLTDAGRNQEPPIRFCDI